MDAGLFIEFQIQVCIQISYFWDDLFFFVNLAIILPSKSTMNGSLFCVVLRTKTAFPFAVGAVVDTWTVVVWVSQLYSEQGQPAGQFSL